MLPVTFCGVDFIRAHYQTIFLKQTLVQEGAAIIAFKLVRDGVFQEAGVTELLQAPGKLEGNFGTRNLQDNISDLKAQVAANTKGANLMHELVWFYLLRCVCFFSLCVY